ncbi:MAG: hypothetical protein WC775_04200 [Patescibacteria group bacterium]|jgi:hypothetical protein
MTQQIISQIDGEFAGYNDGVIFKLANGQVWQQSKYKYKYHYAYCPRVRIYAGSLGSYLMEVEGVDEPVEVTQVSIVVEGSIVSDFRGFKQGAIFKFNNGQVWEQSEAKHSYYYAYRPQATIVDGIDGFQLQVEGMDEPVCVRKVS